MRKWLIVLQTQTEKPANVTRWLRELDQEYQLIKAWEEKISIDINDYGGLVIMGGTMSANDTARFPFLNDEINLIKKWIATEKPLIGICLGAQLMAKALGVKVYVGQQPEIGWFKLRISKEGGSDVLFNGSSPEVTVFEWHHDSFKLPNNTYRLASSELYQNQVFRIGRNAYALQFHPEVDEELIRSWIEIHREELRRMNPNFSQKILMDTKKNLKNYEVLSKHIIKSLCRREICE